MDNAAEIQGKRVTLKRSRPNPLFEDWLEELHEEAKAKKSKLESMLKKALESLSKYPLPLERGSDCLVLNGFDTKLCTFLDRRIEAYSSQSTPGPSSQSSSTSNSQTHKGKSKKKTAQPPNRFQTSDSDVVNNENLNNSSQSNGSTDSRNAPKSRKAYKPAIRSGGYAILIALLEQLKSNPTKPSLDKEQLILKAQPHSQESFTRPKADSFYTAWSNMSRLITKGLVERVRSKKVAYSLTDEGVALAIALLEESKNVPTFNDIIFNNAPSSSKMNTVEPTEISNENSQQSILSSQGTVTSLTSSQRTVTGGTVIDMEAGSYDVILLIDKQETSGVSNKKDPTVAQFNHYPDLKHEFRSLKVGDYTWIARSKTRPGDEIILPYIVERKRMDDLARSIKDGRFHEQKFRLRKCGVPNVIYLVEKFGVKFLGLPITSLMQALANTKVQDSFKVHITESLTENVRFLAMMTKRLTIEYKDKHLIASNAEPQGDMLMIFSYFNKSAIKNKPLTVTETFIKLLLQLRGMSVEKALAITNVYKTPKVLLDMYKVCSQKDGEMLLCNLKYGELSRKVGPTTSKAIYNFFTWKVDS